MASKVASKVGAAKAKTGAAPKAGATSKTAAKPAAGKVASKVAAAKPKSTAASKVGATKTKSSVGSKGPPKAGAKTGLKKGLKGKKKEDPWSAEQKSAACSIQARFRGFKARKDFEKKKSDKAAMKKEIEDLRRKAWLQEVEYERKQQDKRRREVQEEARRRKEEAKLKRDLLEAAYDGEDGDVEELLSRARQTMKEAENTADGNGNTLLSEAAAGGSVSTIELLLAWGADPNLPGEFGRTPIWRACFLGHAAAVKSLLEHGADPRTSSQSGETPHSVANGQDIKDSLDAWDIAVTERKMAEFELVKETKRLEVEKEAAAAVSGARAALEAAQKQHDFCQKQLKHSRQEMEKRITEHDTCVLEGNPQELVEVTLQHIKGQEEAVEKATADAKEATMKLQLAKLQLRETEAGGEEEELPGQLVSIRDLDDVLLKDVGNVVRSSGKWPLVIDVSGQASVFLRYIDSNYVNTLSKASMDANKLRRNIPGAIRYGKPLVLDLLEVDMWGEVERDFELLQKGLLSHLMDKSLMQNEGYLELRRDSDGDDYENSMFDDYRIEKGFKCIVVTSNKYPSDALLESTYALRVKVQK